MTGSGEILEKEANIKGNEFLYSYLEKVDPKSAAIIDARNVRRTIYGQLK